MSRSRLTTTEIMSLQETLSTDYEEAQIRLRDGEYQYNLAKTIASFQVELLFPNVKDVIRKSYGEEKVNSTQFVRKIQTILKKMEKGNVVRIVQKKNPWELQRYSLVSFKFQDINRNRVLFATDLEMEKMKNLLDSMSKQRAFATEPGRIRTRTYILAVMVITSYAVIFWNFMQSSIDPVIFISFFALAVTCSLLFGKVLSQVQT